MLESDRARLSQIEAQILKFERSLSALRVEKQLVQERLNSYKYPVLSFPSEMISEIFVQCLPPYPMCPSLLDSYPPTSLTLVCRQWRAIALATPELWRAIALDNGSYLWRELSKDASRVWTRRSGSLPLSIKLDMKCAHRTPLCELYPVIFDHCARWEHLTLAIAPTNFPTINGPMPLLRYLEFAPNNWYGRFELRDVPQLRVVVLDFTGGRGLTVVLPWQQLTSLTMNEVMTNQCVSILQHTENLVHCDLGLSNSSVELDDPDSRIILSSLESLIFRASSKWATQFLDTFTVPALRSLKITERCIRVDPIHYLTSFIAKSGCQLKILGICRRKIVSDSAYIVAFPHIHELTFDE